jgi:hypothetical protein
MTKQLSKKFEFAQGKVFEVDADEVQRLREAVRKDVVEKIRERAAERDAAVAEARLRPIR